MRVNQVPTVGRRAVAGIPLDVVLHGSCRHEGGERVARGVRVCVCGTFCFWYSKSFINTLFPVCRLPMMKRMRDSLIVDGSNFFTRMALIRPLYTHLKCSASSTTRG